jgi:hypothetical protein
MLCSILEMKFDVTIADNVLKIVNLYNNVVFLKIKIPVLSSPLYIYVSYYSAASSCFYVESARRTIQIVVIFVVGVVRPVPNTCKLHGQIIQ